MFIAIDAHHHYIRADQANKKAHYYCPGCREKFVLKNGDVKRNHFAHLIDTQCHSFTENESFEHLVGKLAIAASLKKYGEVLLESVIPNITQRPDILLKTVNKTYAFEYQCSPISWQRYMERNKGYASEHIEYYWILGEKYFSTKTGQRTMMKFLNHKKILFYIPKIQKFVQFENFRKYDFSSMQYDQIFQNEIFGQIVDKKFKQQKSPSLGKQLMKLQSLIFGKRIDVKLIASLYEQQYQLIQAPWWIHQGALFGLRISNWQWRISILLLLAKIGVHNFIQRRQFNQKLKKYFYDTLDDTYIDYCINQTLYELEIINIINITEKYIIILHLPKWYDSLEEKLAETPK
ncbi:MAG: competence protein CoiA [Leuconostoc fallax]